MNSSELSPGVIETSAQRHRHSHIKAYIAHHHHAIRSSLRHLLHHGIITTVIIMMMGIGLSLPLLLALALDNLQQLNNRWGDERQVTVLLQPLDETKLQTLMQRLNDRSDIEALEYISPQQGLALFEKSIGQNNIIQQLPHNPLPPLLEIIPAHHVGSPESMRVLVSSLKQMPEVTAVKIDMDWIHKLHRWLSFFEMAFYVVMTLLIMAVLLVNLYTIYYTIREQREEIHVIYLIGGTHSFIRRAYLYMGFFYGFLSAGCAWLWCGLALSVIDPKLQQLAILYDLTWKTIHVDVYAGGWVLLLSGLMGWLGAWFAVQTELLHVMQYHE